MSYSGHFLYASFFSVPCHISHPKGCISHFPHFQLSCNILESTVQIYQFSCFSIFLVIFQYLNSVIFIFRDFQFSCHIPGPTVCISLFSRFSVISTFFKSSSVYFSFSMIFSFLAIFHVLQWTFLIFQVFSIPRHISGPKVCISHFPHFQVSCLFPGSTVCINNFSCFSIFLIIYHYLNSVILIFHDFQFSCHIHVLQWTFVIFKLFQSSSPYVTS
jgi:hypothetical protein